jgi:hypothetical protein
VHYGAGLELHYHLPQRLLPWGEREDSVNADDEMLAHVSKDVAHALAVLPPLFMSQRYAGNLRLFRQPISRDPLHGERWRWGSAGYRGKIGDTSDSVTSADAVPSQHASPLVLFPIAPRTVQAMLTVTFGPKRQ